MKIVLASASPRRRALLEMLGLAFETCPARGEEKAGPGLSPSGIVKSLALAKAGEVFEKRPESLVLAADTVVELEGRILGKPKDRAEAESMLRALSGRGHRVFTGVALIREGTRLAEAEETQVFFRALSYKEISAYVETGEPMDKAGSYGVQGIGSLFVERIEGDFFNVMGLPLCRLGRMLNRMGITLL